MKELRLGTIGSGSIVHTILDNVKLVDGIRLTAVYSRTEEKGSQLAAEYGAERVYTDLDAFLGDEEMNTVYIASPNLLHYEQTKKALLAGKHVICEKPFCTKAEQARELTALAKEKQLFLADAVPTAFLPNLEALKKELPKVGRVKLVLGNYSQYSSRYDQVLKGGGAQCIQSAICGRVPDGYQLLQCVFEYGIVRKAEIIRLLSQPMGGTGGYVGSPGHAV